MVTESEQERVNNFFADPQPYLRNNPYVDLRANAVRRLLPRRAGMSMVDLGCGDGRISIPLVGEADDLMLVDSSAAMLDLAMRSVPANLADRVRCQRVDLADFEPQRHYDVVLCIGVLAHVQSPAATLRQIARLVGPNGYALIQITDDAYFLGRMTHRAGDFRRRQMNSSVHTLNHMTLESVQTELLDAGLEFQPLPLCVRAWLAPASGRRDAHRGACG